jgi:hypothetical protein
LDHHCLDDSLMLDLATLPPAPSRLQARCTIGEKCGPGGATLCNFLKVTLLLGRTTVQSILAPCWDNRGTAARRNLNKQKLSFDSPQTFASPDYAKVIFTLFCSSSTMISSSIDVRNMEAREDFKQSFLYLGKLLKMIVTLPSRFIEYDQLAEFNISLTDFSLHSDLTCDAVPRFFKPFPHDLMEESFKHTSQLEEDIGWPSYDIQYQAHFTEPHGVEWTLGKYHRYVFDKWEESPSERSIWQFRR